MKSFRWDAADFPDSCKKPQAYTVYLGLFLLQRKGQTFASHTSGTGGLPGGVTKYQEDIELSPRKVVKQYLITKHWCSHCKEYVRSDRINPQIYRMERFGPNLMAYILYARYRLRLPYNKIQSSLVDLHDFAISEGEVAAQLQKAATLFADDFTAITQLIAEATSVHCDETGWRINGQHWWVWVFVTSSGVRYEVEDTRGKGVPKAVLGDKSNRVIISDFYAAYANLPGENQYCWVHLLRDSRTTESSFHEVLKAIYQQLVAELGKPLPERDVGALRQQLQDAAQADYSHEEQVETITKLQKRIRKTTEQLITCLRYEGIKPENNTAERALRNHVVMRKISGGSRSQAAAKAMAQTTSVLDTLAKRHPDQGFFETVIPKLQGKIYTPRV